MLTTKGILARLRRHIERNTEYEPTNYRIAKMLGVTAQAIDHLVKTNAPMKDEAAASAARVLGLKPAYLMMSAHIQRGLSSSDCKKEWREIQEAFNAPEVGKLADLLHNLPAPVGERLPYKRRATDR